jgi:hypothetical protein
MKGFQTEAAAIIEQRLVFLETNIAPGVEIQSVEGRRRRRGLILEGRSGEVMRTTHNVIEAESRRRICGLRMRGQHGTRAGDQSGAKNQATCHDRHKFTRERFVRKIVRSKL